MNRRICGREGNDTEKEANKKKKWVMNENREKYDKGKIYTKISMTNGRT